MATDTIVTALSAYCSSNGHKFIYGTKDVQNLIGSLNVLSASQALLTLFPLKEDITTNEFGAVESITYSSTILLAKKSQLDAGSSAEDGVDYYLEKYEAVIKHLKLEAKTTMLSALACDGFAVNKFSIVEVINLFAYNVDGIYIHFTLNSIEPDLITA